MKSEIYTCDVCGVQKKESNHWFFTRIGEAFHLYPWAYFIGVDHEGSIDKSIKINHICGHVCAQRKLAEFLDQQK